MILIFCSFFKILPFFEFFQPQGPGNLLYVLIIEHFIVSSNNGTVFNVFMSRILAFYFESLQF